MEIKEAINKAGEMLKDRSRRCRRHFTDGEDRYCMVGAVEHVMGMPYYKVDDAPKALAIIVNYPGHIAPWNTLPSKIYDAWDNATDAEQDAIVERMINYND